MNPVHPHCGPGNKISKDPSSNAVDNFCRTHDIDYGKLQTQYGMLTPYFYYNNADREFQRNLSGQKGFLPSLYKGYFDLKEKFAPRLKYKMLGRKRYSVSDIENPFKRLKLSRARRAPRFRRRIWRRRPYSYSFRKMARYGKSRYRPRTYRRRYRRRYYKGKRYYSSRSVYRNYLHAEPSRSYIKETDDTLDTGTGSTYFWAPQAFLSVTRIKSAWADTGDDANALVFSGTAETGVKALLQRSSMNMEFWNNNLSPYYIKVYWCIARQGRPGSSIEPNVAVIGYLDSGLKERMLDVDETILTSGTTSIASTVHGINPFDSPQLTEYYKVIGGKGGVVQPGGFVRFRWRANNKFIDGRQLVAGSPKDIPGVTIVPLFKISMACGVDNTDFTEYTNVTGIINCRQITRHTWKKSVVHKSLLAVSSTTTTAFTNGGVFPTDDEQKADL